MNEINFVSNDFLDLQLFSGIELTDADLEDKFLKEYITINKKKDFDKYKSSYLHHKNSLNYDYQQFVELVESKLNTLTEPDVPQKVRECIELKLKLLDPSSRNGSLIGRIANVARGRRCREILEREGHVLVLADKIFQANAQHQPYAKISEELAIRISRLPDTEFSQFLNNTFFKYSKSYGLLYNSDKLKILSKLSQAQKSTLIRQLLQRNDWFIQLYGIYPTPGLVEEDIEEHKKIIAEIPDNDFIIAFEREMENIVKFRNDVPQDVYEREVCYSYRKQVMRMFIEKGMKIFLKSENSAQLTRLLGTLNNLGCIPRDCNDIKDNILALMFSNPTLLSQQEIDRFKEILPKESYSIRDISRMFD